MGCVNSPCDLLENSPNSGSELWLVSAELASVCVYVEAAEQRLQLQAGSEASCEGGATSI